MSSPISRRPACEVFLSFRGSDTRNHFADFLHDILEGANIEVFRDEEDLESGEEINPQLIQAIEQSKISIPVISEDFASSNSCLMELEKMVDRIDSKNHTIIPIFYHVEPSDVRNSRGTFQKANKNQKRALRRIGKLSGHHLVEKSDKRPTKVIKRVVRKVSRKLKKEDLILPKQLVDVDPHVQDIMAKLKVDYHNGKAVKIGAKCGKVLIYGIPGVGKTILAKCVYNKLNHLYDACSFLEKIQEEIKRKGVVHVQNKLNSHLHKKYARKFDSSDDALRHFQDRFHAMKVLVLLDDVKDHDQLSDLVGELDWLRQRSTVIVTSQRDDVLQDVKGAERFGLRTMQKDKALQLFSRHAFEDDSPPEHFKKLSTNIVTATDGLPLALYKAGKSLRNMKENVWKETPTALEQTPEQRVREAFFKSYNTLKGIEKDMFLDIACFFIGQDPRIPYYMWDDCDFFPSISFESLRAMSLVEIGEDEKLCMLGILKTFGREIVKNESKKVPRKRSRLCNHKEALDVLKRKKGTEMVEALGLEFADGSAKDTILECNGFKGLWNLRFLKLDQADICGNFEDHFSNLKWLDWRGCAKIFDVQSLNLNLQELLILDLSESQVHKDWRGWDLLKQTRKLKVLNLTGCVHLIATPKFPLSMELERFIMEGCSNLAVIHPSFGNLKKLVSLNMKGCNLLSNLPDLGPMRGLEELLIDRTSIRLIDFVEGSVSKLNILTARDCKDLNRIPSSIRYLKSLKFLSLDGSEILTLQESIELLEKLETLSLKNCERLSYLPDGIGKLSSLQSLDLSHTRIQNLPPSVNDLKAMKVLKMTGTFIHEFPEAVLNLEKLEEIDLSSCQRLEGRIDYDIGKLSSLAILKLSDTRIASLPPSISRLARLRELHILGCSNLQSPPELSPSVNVFRDLVN